MRATEKFGTAASGANRAPARPEPSPLAYVTKVTNRTFTPKGGESVQKEQKVNKRTINSTVTETANVDELDELREQLEAHESDTDASDDTADDNDTADTADALRAAFRAACDAADVSTNVVPPAAFDAAYAAYVAVPSRERAAVAADVSDAIADDPSGNVRAALKLRNALQAKAAERTTKVRETDIAGIWAGKLHAARFGVLAAETALAAQVTDADTLSRIATKCDELSKQELFAQISPMAAKVVGALKLDGKPGSGQKVGGGVGGARANMATHIAQAVDALGGTGPFKVTDVSARSTQECPDGARSVEAVRNAVDKLVAAGTYVATESRAGGGTVAFTVA